MDECVFDVSSTNAMGTEQNESLSPEGGKTDHLLVGDQVELVEHRRVLLEVLGRVVLLLLLVKPQAMS